VITAPLLRFVRLVTLFVASNLASASAQEFIAGADLSHLAFVESRGAKYKGSDGETDAFAILGNRGLNCVRLRLFTSTAAQAAADVYNYTNNLDYTLPLAQRVKQAGLKFLLDFHYSDSWADPGKQTKPAAWANLAFTQLEAELFRYSSNTIAAFKAAGAMPDFVQIGNEISVGFLWPEGSRG
jgi:arabinogalactan endo-1,4-beta-galactosidase